jgi:hypothetical protein
VIVDYLFLHKDIGRIQAETHPDNDASRRILEKVGFTFEGRIRRSFFSRGSWRDTAMHSILREEWREPKVLPAGAPPPTDRPVEAAPSSRPGRGPTRRRSSR